MYMSDVADFVREHQVNFNSFADHSQIYTMWSVNSRDALWKSDTEWTNRFNLNTDKTELVWTGFRHNQAVSSRHKSWSRYISILKF